MQDIYKHYYRPDSAGLVVFAFSDAITEPLETDYLIGESDQRSFTPEIFNANYQSIYKIVGGVVVERSPEELEAALPGTSKTPDQLMIEALQAQSGILLLELAKAQSERAAQDMKIGMMLVQIAEIQEGIG